MEVQQNGTAVAAPVTASGEVAEVQTAARCLNCAAPVVGAFCPSCGEEHARNRVLPIGALARQLWHEFVGVDTRVVRTLRLVLFRPGQASVEYVSGRRRGYVRPLRLYLMLSAVYFLVVAVAQPYAVSPEPLFDQLEATGEMEGFTAELAEYGLTLDLYKERLARRFNKAMALVYLLTIPLLAMALKLFYLRGGRYFHAHFVFALHYAAFCFLLGVALVPLIVLADPGAEANLLLAFSILITTLYLALAMRRFYGESWGWTALKAAGATAVYFIFFVALFVPAFLAIFFFSARM